MDQVEHAAVTQTTQECPVSVGRRFDLAAPQYEDLFYFVSGGEGFDQFEDLGGGGDEGAEDRYDGCELVRAGDCSQLL